MKRFVGFSVVLVAVVAFAATQAFARGGHGGGHHGGGHHGGGHHAHHSSHHAHHAAHHNRHHHVAHHGNHRAFSHGWYNHHHGAWGWGNGGYGWGNPWAAATLGATAGWLGANALDWNNGYPATTVYTGNNDTIDNQPASNETVNNDESGEAASDPQTADNDADDNQPEVSSADAAALAAQGNTEPAKDAKFMPLGVFTIAPENQDEATAILHLAVSKDGVLRGTLLDLKTDKDEHIQGAVDKKTGLVAWTVANDDKVVFQTSLKDLTEQSGPVAVHFANGKSDTWTIAHHSEKDAEAEESKTGNNAATGNPANPK
jgi:hypothetical protein